MRRKAFIIQDVSYKGSKNASSPQLTACQGEEAMDLGLNGKTALVTGVSSRVRKCPGPWNEPIGDGDVVGSPYRAF